MMLPGKYISGPEHESTERRNTDVTENRFGPTNQSLVQTPDILQEKLDKILEILREREKSSSRKSEKILATLIHVRQQVDNGNRYSTPKTTTTTIDQEASGTRIDSAESINELITPPFRTAPDTILEWPVLKAACDYESGYISDALFEQCFLNTNPYLEGENEQKSDTVSSAAFVDEEVIPRLVGLYLANVHIRSPVVDVKLARRWAIRVSTEGCRWDGPTCLTVRNPSILDKTLLTHHS